MQLLDEGKSDLAVFAATATARRGRPEALLRVFLWLISSRRTVDAASLALALMRYKHFHFFSLGLGWDFCKGVLLLERYTWTSQ